MSQNWDLSGGVFNFFLLQIRRHRVETTQKLCSNSRNIPTIEKMKNETRPKRWRKNWRKLSIETPPGDAAAAPSICVAMATAGASSEGQNLISLRQVLGCCSDPPCWFYRPPPTDDRGGRVSAPHSIQDGRHRHWFFTPRPTAAVKNVR